MQIVRRLHVRLVQLTILQRALLYQRVRGLVFFFFKCVFHLTFRRFTAKLFYLWVPLPAVRSAGWKAAV